MKTIKKSTCLLLCICLIIGAAVFTIPAFAVGTSNDSEIEFYAEAVGNTTLIVKPNETVTLSVAAQSSGNISYEWSGVYDFELANEDGSSITVYPDSTLTFCTCYVTDDLGNSQYVNFEIHVNLYVQEYEYEETYLHVKPGKTATLKAKASVEEGSIHYKWEKGYYKYKEDGSREWTYETIDGATSDIIVTDPMTESCTYLCIVSDDFGYEEYIFFHLYFDNGFSAKIAGDSTKYIPYNEPATIKVDAVVDAGEIHYQWYKQTEGYDENGKFYRNDELLEGETSDTLITEPVTNYTTYFCKVSDDYDWDYVYAYVYVDSGLSVERVGDYEKYVYPELSETLEVSAKVNVGNIHYQWYIEDTAIEGATESLVDTIPFFETEESLLESFYNSFGYVYYWCYVSDDFGRTEWIVYRIKNENDFSAEAVGDSYIYVKPGDTATLEVTASARLGDIHFRWGGNINNPENIKGSYYTTDAITDYRYIYCIVTDDYGNKKWINFNVNVRSELTAEAVNSSTKTVKQGDSQTLKVSVLADSENLNYRWFKKLKVYAPDGSFEWQTTAVENATSDTLFVEAIDDDVEYYCEVSDEYANKVTVTFTISITQDDNENTDENNPGSAQNTNAFAKIINKISNFFNKIADFFKKMFKR